MTIIVICAALVVGVAVFTLSLLGLAIQYDRKRNRTSTGSLATLFESGKGRHRA